MVNPEMFYATKNVFTVPEKARGTSPRRYIQLVFGCCAVGAGSTVAATQTTGEQHARADTRQ
jgi:hypothetical protein